MSGLYMMLTGALAAIVTAALLTWSSRGSSTRPPDGVIRYGWRIRVVAAGTMGIALLRLEHHGVVERQPAGR